MPSVTLKMKESPNSTGSPSSTQSVAEHVTTFKNDSGDEEGHHEVLSNEIMVELPPLASTGSDKEHQESMNGGMTNKGFANDGKEEIAENPLVKKNRFRVEIASQNLDVEKSPGAGGGGSDISDGEMSDAISTVNSLAARKFNPALWSPKGGGGGGGGGAHSAVINTEEVMLVHSQLRKINVKDFHREVRARMDVEDFFKEGDIYLDLNMGSLPELVRFVLNKLRVRERDLNVEEALLMILNHPLESFQNSLQGTHVYDGWVDVDQSWICGMCSLPSLTQRRITILRLRHLLNVGPTCQEVRFLVLILTPANSKKTKTDVEIGRTFATLFCSVQFRSDLLQASTEASFKAAIEARVNELRETRRKKFHERKVSNVQASFNSQTGADDKSGPPSKCLWLGRGIRDDFMRRARVYLDDYMDGVKSTKAKTKLVSTVFFLYFAILLPCLALGVTNYDNTDGMMTIRRMIIAQALGGLIFAVIGGQALVIVISTAPVVIFTLIIKNISEDIGEDFFQMYAASGLCNSLFLVLYSVLNACNLMKYAYRSVDEIFGVFISMAFTYDAVKSMIHIFHLSYCSPRFTDLTELELSCGNNVTDVLLLDNSSYTCTPDLEEECSKASCMLAILLMLGTVWLGFTLFNFNKSPYLDSRKRELLADYALPAAVLTFAFLASFVFRDIDSDQIKGSQRGQDELRLVNVFRLSYVGWFYSIGLGFCLSILFFMDQNISASFVNNPKNNLKKGTAYHYDLLVLALVNIILSLLGLPWLHGALPHSPLHVRALAEFEERMSQGVMTDTIVKVHETRLTSIIANAAIGASVYLLPSPLDLIPIPVLNGVLLYVALISLTGNEFFERLLLWITEQSAYPPSSYVRHVKQRWIHLFTLTQIGQLAVLCALGFAPWPYLKMVFPVALLAFMPFRHFVIPRAFAKTYLDALDGH